MAMEGLSNVIDQFTLMWTHPEVAGRLGTDCPEPTRDVCQKPRPAARGLNRQSAALKRSIVCARNR